MRDGIIRQSTCKIFIKTLEVLLSAVFEGTRYMQKIIKENKRKVKEKITSQ